MFRYAILLVMFVSVFTTQAQTRDANVALDAKNQKAIKKAMDRGIRFLRNTQNSQGHWDNPGITALILHAFFRCHRQYSPQDGPWVRKPLEYLVNCQKADGGIYVDQLANYNTSIAIMALTAHPDVKRQYQSVIDKAKNFLRKLQCDEGEGYTPKKDYFYGGIGYGGDERPDLSNTQFALEALRATGVPSDDPVFKKAIVFLQRCQNRSESNDLQWAGNDGGFAYSPMSSHAGSYTENGQRRYRSYGSMTYAGIKSYIYADIKQDDPRFQAAYKWIQRHYDLTQNPGMGAQGLFYYYHSFAKTLALLANPVFVDERQRQHNWRKDLAQVLLSKQSPEGYWKNENSRWWEADPRLVTAYVILTLAYCLEEL